MSTNDTRKAIPTTAHLNYWAVLGLHDASELAEHMDPMCMLTHAEREKLAERLISESRRQMAILSDGRAFLHADGSITLVGYDAPVSVLIKATADSVEVI